MKNKNILAVLLPAFGLRLIALDARPVWYDEAFSVLLAEKNFNAIAVGTAADTMPPLYYTLLHFWLPFVGESAFALRMLSVGLGMLIVAMMYAVGARTLGSRTGVWAAFFAALAPFQIYHAQEMRMYAPLALGALVLFYGVLREIARARFAFAAMVLGTAIALYSHNLAFATLLAPSVFFTVRREWRVLAKLIAAQFLGLLAFAPWLTYVPGQVEKIQRAFFTQPPGIADVLQMLVVFTTYLPAPPLVFVAELFVTVSTLAFAVLGIVRWYRRGAPRELGLLIAFVFVPPALLFMLSYVIRPVFVPRGAIASALAYYVLVAALVARAPRLGQIAVGLIAAVIALTTLPFFYLSWDEWRRAPFASADQFLRTQTRADDLILHDNKLSFFPMHYYDRALSQAFFADPPGSGNDTLALGSEQALGLYPVELENSVRGRARIWFVIFQTALDQAVQEGHLHGNLSRFDGTMRSRSITSFGDLRIYLYEPR